MANEERQTGDQIGLTASQDARDTRRGLVPAEDAQEVRRGLMPATDAGIPNDAGMESITEARPTEAIDNAAGMNRGNLGRPNKVTRR